MRNSIFILLCALIFAASANADLMSYLIENGQDKQPVVVGLTMIRCGIFSQNRCPSISVRMGSDTFEKLGRPEKVKWDYTALGVSPCKVILNPLCYHRDINSSSAAEFVYNDYDDEYYLYQRGRAYNIGGSFSLNSICLINNDNANCQNLNIVAKKSGVDYIEKTLYFIPPVLRSTLDNEYPEQYCSDCSG